jgi:predicted transcriptional regulator
VSDLDAAILAHLARNNDTALTVTELRETIHPYTAATTIRRHLDELRAAGMVAKLGVAANGARCWGITRKGLDRWRARQVTGKQVG